MQPPQYFSKMVLIPLALAIGVSGCNRTPDRVSVLATSVSPATVQCTETQIKTSINRLGKGDTAAFDFLVSCNSQAVPALIKLLKHQDENIRIVTIAILGQIGEGATEAIPLLEEVLKDRREENENSRIIVVDALGKMGQAAIPALIAALKDQDSLVRSQVASALGQIGQPAVPALITALKDQDIWVRYQAASALGQIGEEAKNAVPALNAAL
jgi:HEAT repeat protein